MPVRISLSPTIWILSGADIPMAVSYTHLDVYKRQVCECVNLGWGTFDVAETLSEKIGLPVKVGNDANVAALGEMWKGGGQGCQNGVMVTLGTGVGGGIIINGSIVGGVHGAGGEIGHMKVSETETETCGCGKRGCLEQYASATGIVRLTKQRLAADDAKTSLRSLPEVTAGWPWHHLMPGAVLSDVQDVYKRQVHPSYQVQVSHQLPH